MVGRNGKWRGIRRGIVIFFSFYLFFRSSAFGPLDWAGGPLKDGFGYIA